MRYFTLPSQALLHPKVCGNLISEHGFLHHQRCFDETVLIFVLEGTLSITQSGTPFSIQPNHFLLLPAKEEHFGHLPSMGRLSYLWLHFTSDASLTQTTLPAESPVSDLLLPETGTVSLSSRFPLFFHQLLDIFRLEKCHSAQMTELLLRLLLCELSQEARDSLLPAASPHTPFLQSVAKWLRANCCRRVTSTELTAVFGYNSDYLSSLFKKEFGSGITAYLNRSRIEVSKNLLRNTSASIKEAAYSCGFPDEKYYMKLFKRLVGMTPSEYQSRFFEK